MSSEGSREARARLRRDSGYPGKVVRCGDAKPALYEELTAIERLEQLWALCRAQWLLSGRELPVYARDQAPGEIFEIESWQSSD